MSEAPPIVFVWEGDGFKPATPYQQNLADKYYVVGERYHLITHEPRSTTSHNHFFACVADAHANLPEDLLAQYPSPDALRKWALIKAGYCDQHTFACSSKAEALRLAAFIKPIDAYSIVVAKESTVTRYTAKSQSQKAMGKEDFQVSKSRVLDILADLLGSTRKALEESRPA